MADKDIDASLRLFKENGFSDRTKIFTVPVKDNPRAQTPEKRAAQFESFGFEAIPCGDIGKAYEMAIEEEDIILLCGSLYLYKDFAEDTKKI